MRALSRLALIVALTSTAACGGDDGASFEPSLSGVFPSSAFIGRQVRVEVSGDVTQWTEAATVSFGDGITVDNVAVASPTALFVDITIAGTAAPGLRDVTVTDGGETLTLTQAFELETPVRLTVQGTVAQGSIGLYTLRNLDFENPFDTTSTGDGFFTPIEYTNIEIAGPTGVTFTVDSVTDYSISGIVFMNVDAMPGAITVNSGPIEGKITSPAGALEVAARTAMPLTSGTQVMGMVSEPYGSQLYSIDAATAPSITTFATTSTNADASPSVALLPNSGSFDELLAYSDRPAHIMTAAGKLYVVYFDISGTSGYQYTLRGTTATATTAAEAANNDTGATAQTASMLPFLMTGATLSSDTDEDWIQITVPAGRRIRVITGGSDPFTDTVVQIYGPNNPATEFGDESSDDFFHEDHTSPVTTTAGTYYVKVFASSFFDPQSNTYVAGIVLE